MPIDLLGVLKVFPTLSKLWQLAPADVALATAGTVQQLPVKHPAYLTHAEYRDFHSQHIRGLCESEDELEVAVAAAWPDYHLWIEDQSNLEGELIGVKSASFSIELPFVVNGQASAHLTGLEVTSCSAGAFDAVVRLNGPVKLEKGGIHVAEVDLSLEMMSPDLTMMRILLDELVHGVELGLELTYIDSNKVGPQSQVKKLALSYWFKPDFGSYEIFTDQELNELESRVDRLKRQINAALRARVGEPIPRQTPITLTPADKMIARLVELTSGNRSPLIVTTYAHGAWMKAPGHFSDMVLFLKDGDRVFCVCDLTPEQQQDKFFSSLPFEPVPTKFEPVAYGMKQGFYASLDTDQDLMAIIPAMETRAAKRR
ncbi:hypothetical protein HNP46_006083 [Pseudomonas nitritireducens]|uniref:Uncharacterized protein n=1 Tax=Pseudomonas nitroreducens TaxID=46680 RepID=A0A7W7P5C7_PSENT|nr:hypothetical protein [Pseudomonas nitritireducens]MBB4867172.1 hypothetical protein [Pseudomonas nitritireducens]